MSKQSKILENRY